MAPEKPRKTRQSCDNCQRVKVKCGQERPVCGRCASHKVSCVYSLSRRMGRPRARKDSLQQTSAGEAEGSQANIQDSTTQRSSLPDGNHSSPSRRGQSSPREADVVQESSSVPLASCQPEDGASFSDLRQLQHQPPLDDFVLNSTLDTQFNDQSNTGIPSVSYGAFDGSLTSGSLDHPSDNQFPFVSTSPSSADFHMSHNPVLGIDLESIGSPMQTMSDDAFEQLMQSSFAMPDVYPTPRSNSVTAHPAPMTSNAASPLHLPPPTQRRCRCSAALLQDLCRLTQRNLRNITPSFLASVLRDSKDALDRSLGVLNCQACVSTPSTVLLLSQIVEKSVTLLRLALSLSRPRGSLGGHRPAALRNNFEVGSLSDFDTGSLRSYDSSSGRSYSMSSDGPLLPEDPATKFYSVRIGRYVVPEADCHTLVRKLVDTRLRQAKNVVRILIQKLRSEPDPFRFKNICDALVADCARRLSLEYGSALDSENFY